MNADEGKSRARAAVQALFDRYFVLASKRSKGHIDFDGEVMKNLKLIDAGPEGSVVYELHIAPGFSNLNKHHKVHTPVLPEHQIARIPWDDEFEKQWGIAEKTETGVKSKI
ncbi:hypothetical protein E8E13_000547 [Curvularia kusanoi]|uniref:Uncharacterized protein n=1 Tax=Curvularia kusanoi TaxID=90978 RepID=A0A9P4T3D2_CURKU|nr:hypothetical protein E8E13_000547 [Curvularia kusanoi]